MFLVVPCGLVGFVGLALRQLELGFGAMALNWT